MLRKDYLMRQFEEFGKVLAVILGYKKDKDWERFEIDIDKAVNTFTGYEIKDLLEKDESGFEKIILGNTKLKPDQIKILADLLYEHSFSFGEKNETEKMNNALRKSLFLYNLYAGNLTVNDYNVEVQYRISFIKKIIPPTNPQ